MSTIADVVPEGRSGNVEIEHFVISEAEMQFSVLRAMATGRMREIVQPGRYARLLVDGEIMMTDTTAEQRDSKEFLRHAKGDILVAGLGLGMVLPPILAKREVTSVTIVEISKDVIKLVSPHFNDSRIKIIHADFISWKPPRGSRWDTIFIDIWPNICGDDLTVANKLRAKYRRRLRKGGWIGVWAEEERKLC